MPVRCNGVVISFYLLSDSASNSVKVALSTSQGIQDHKDNDNAVGFGGEAEAHQRCDRGKLDANPIWWLQQSQGLPHLSRLGSRDLPVAIFDRIVLEGDR